MASRKVNTEGIDEELLIASIGKKRSEEQMPPPVQEQSVQEQEEKLQGTGMAVSSFTQVTKSSSSFTF